ncbi:DoxX family protein [Calidifontibacter sp. DB0510]|uniref:DoxX family protein n=1 Tax=Metallococcus carri TaxID=1656884 RepID=A0A967EAD7_9MICO|nr:DoxX family protein [Metallococcus carri]NHN56160.1 DoxX family protein [Metallococcus carri]NOP38789.1 DoxX family protein [Calidifontibacter sp. DB2511S]
MPSLTTTTSHLRSVAVTAARVLLGVIFIAHGWQKLNTNGMQATTTAFEKMGVPAPKVSAWFAALVELGGGVLLILGAATTIVSLLLVIDMAGAFWFVHRTQGIFVPGGWELVAALGLGALLFAATGPGPLSIDRLFRRRMPARAASV